MRLFQFQFLLFSFMTFNALGQVAVSLESGLSSPELIGRVDGTPFLLTHPNNGRTLGGNNYYGAERGYYFGLVFEKGLESKLLLRIPAYFALLKYGSRQIVDEGPLMFQGFWGVLDHRSHHLGIAPELVYQWKYGLQAGVGWQFIYNSLVETEENGVWTVKELELRHFNLGPQISLRFNKTPFYLDIRCVWTVIPYFTEEIVITDEDIAADVRMNNIHLGLGYYILKPSK